MKSRIDHGWDADRKIKEACNCVQKYRNGKITSEQFCEYCRTVASEIVAIAKGVEDEGKD